MHILLAIIFAALVSGLARDGQVYPADDDKLSVNRVAINHLESPHDIDKRSYEVPESSQSAQSESKSFGQRRETLEQKKRDVSEDLLDDDAQQQQPLGVEEEFEDSLSDTSNKDSKVSRSAEEPEDVESDSAKKVKKKAADGAQNPQEETDTHNIEKKSTDDDSNNNNSEGEDNKFPRSIGKPSSSKSGNSFALESKVRVEMPSWKHVPRVSKGKESKRKLVLLQKILLQEVMDKAGSRKFGKPKIAETFTAFGEETTTENADIMVTDFYANVETTDMVSFTTNGELEELDMVHMAKMKGGGGGNGMVEVKKGPNRNQAFDEIDFEKKKLMIHKAGKREEEEDDDEEEMGMAYAKQSVASPEEYEGVAERNVKRDYAKYARPKHREINKKRPRDVKNRASKSVSEEKSSDIERPEAIEKRAYRHYPSEKRPNQFYRMKKWPSRQFIRRPVYESGYPSAIDRDETRFDSSVRESPRNQRSQSLSVSDFGNDMNYDPLKSSKNSISDEEKLDDRSFSRARARRSSFLMRNKLTHPTDERREAVGGQPTRNDSSIHPDFYMIP